MNFEYTDPYFDEEMLDSGFGYIASEVKQEVSVGETPVSMGMVSQDFLAQQQELLQQLYLDIVGIPGLEDPGMIHAIQNVFRSRGVQVPNESPDTSVFLSDDVSSCGVDLTAPSPQYFSSPVTSSSPVQNGVDPYDPYDASVEGGNTIHADDILSIKELVRFQGFTHKIRVAGIDSDHFYATQVLGYWVVHISDRGTRTIDGVKVRTSTYFSKHHLPSFQRSRFKYNRHQFLLHIGMTFSPYVHLDALATPKSLDEFEA